MRHGETDGNVARRHQHPETQLNDLGKEQARIAAYEISTLKPTHIITSTQLRAVETTKIINEYCDIIPDTHPAFEELRRPDWLVGNRYTSLTTAWYVLLWFLNKKQEGGETYADLLERVKEARAYLETFPDDARVVVVSHAVFTNIFLEHLCSDERMSFLRAIKRFWLILRIRNATILHLKHHNTKEGTCLWEFMSAMRVYQKS